MRRWIRHHLLPLLALFLLPAAHAFAQIGTSYLLSESNAPFTTITGGAVLLANQPTFANDASLGYGYDLAVTAATNIGFSFRFNGANYTQFRTTTSGLLILGNPTVSDIRANQLGSPQITAPIIAPFWEHQNVYDQNCVALPAGIRYELTGTAPNRVLTVQWRTGLVLNGSTYYSYSCPTTNTMYMYQVRLYESSDVIAFHYSAMYGGAIASTVSIGLAQGPGNFLSVTPGTPARADGRSANDQVYMNRTPIAVGTVYTFSPCGFVMNGRLGAGNGGSTTLANGDIFFQGFAVQRGSSATYTPFDIAIPGGLCPNRAYTAQILGSNEYFFGTPGTTTQTVSVPAGGGPMPVAITFAPTANGVRAALLQFTDVVSGSSRTFALSAQGTPRIIYTGDVVQGGTNPPVDNDSLMLGISVLRRQQQTLRPISILNTNATPNFSTGPVSVTATIDSLGGSSYQYKLVDPVSGALVDSYTTAIAGGGSYIPQILFRASSAGKQVARLRVTNADGENRTFYLAATSAAPAGRFEVDGESVIGTAQFRATAGCAGEQATVVPVVVTNTGFGPLTLTSFEVYKTDTIDQQGTPNHPLVRDPQQRAIRSANYGLFENPGVAPITANPSPFPFVVPERSSRTLYLTFVADHPGKRWGRVILRTNAQNLTGDDTTAFGADAVEGIVSFDVYGTGVGSQLAADSRGAKLRPSLFAATHVGDSVDLGIPIVNTGVCDLRINRGKLRIFSGDVSEFRLISVLTGAQIDAVTGDYLLAPGMADSIVVRFRPSRGGTRMATLWLQTNDSTIWNPGIAERGAYYLDLHGRGLSGLDARELVLSPVVIGGSVAGAVVVENTQTTAVGVSYIGFLGDDAAQFAEDNGAPWRALPFQVLPGEKVSLGVRMTPVGQTGLRRTTVIVVTTTNDTVRIPVRGEAGVQTLVVSPNTLFDNVTIQTGQSRRQTVRIANDGTLPVRITKFEITGTDRANYLVGKLPRMTLDAGQTEYLEVTYAPTSVGQSSAELVFTASNGQTYTVVLGGTSQRIRIDPIDPVDRTTRLPGGDLPVAGERLRDGARPTLR